MIEKAGRDMGGIVVFLIAAIMALLLVVLICRNIDWQKFKDRFPLASPARVAGQ